MADALKPKLLLRSGASFSTADKITSPGVGLMLNHGKPNFTIQRTTKSKINIINGGNCIKNNNNNSISNNNNNLNSINLNNKNGQHYNGILKSSQQSSTKITNTTSNDEAKKIHLRRTKITNNTSLQKVEEDSEPEFIKAQRKIQERLAKDNILDFDKRKSGYFTHVMMSPTSPNSKKTFGETMESPEPVPILEFTKISSQSQIINGESDKIEKFSEDIKNFKNIQNGYTNISIDTEQNEDNILHVSDLQENYNNQKNLNEKLEKIDENKINEHFISETKEINFEPKTVISFAHELSNEQNKYPDTVKVITEVESSIEIDEELQELTKLKFDIQTDEEMKNIKVTPILRTE